LKVKQNIISVSLIYSTMKMVNHYQKVFPLWTTSRFPCTKLIYFIVSWYSIAKQLIN